MFDANAPFIALAAFIAAGIAITLAGTKMSGVADKLADRTGLGEAIVGAVLLGVTTSLAGSVTSVTAALGGHASLAVSNAIGGIAAQTVFLAAADLVYRRSNLEHAGASEPHLVQAGVLIILLTLPAIAMVTPEVSLLAIHPISLLLIAVYIFGLQLSHAARVAPMWKPTKTDETREDIPDAPEADDPSLGGLGLVFLGLMVVVGVAGWVIAEAAVPLAQASGLSQSVVGSLFTAIATSMPELVTTLAAVRRGALQLAIGGIIGGNTFDVLFLVASDTAYQGGSIYHAVGPAELFMLLSAILMTSILLLGLIRRERYGFAKIGFESSAILVVFFASVAINAFAG